MNSGVLVEAAAIAVGCLNISSGGVLWRLSAGGRAALNRVCERSSGNRSELVKKKKRKDEDVVPAPAEPADEEEVSVIDLMEVLKRSLEGGGAGRKTPKTARKRKTA